MPDRYFLNQKWSDLARKALILSLVTTIVLSVVDGIFAANYYATPSHTATQIILKTWIFDFRYLAEQGIYAATLLLVGAKFFETRTSLTIAFDKMDGSKMSVRGPDEQNTIWIGRKYKTALEAESVAAALESRLRDEAA